MNSIKNIYEKIKENKKTEFICFVVILVVLIGVMLIFINQKQGFHEDEMFSYGSSNFRYDNMFQAYGREDDFNKEMFEKVLDTSSVKNTIRNALYYATHEEQFNNEKQAIKDTFSPIWKTKEEAHEYLTIQKSDILNYVSVYYNQTRDVHPPLFYFIIHTVSIAFFDTFSIYIIFIINIVFFVLTCVTLRKILLLFNKKHLTLITLLLYGLSMGAISTVIYQRMYMMVTCFVLMYLYINLKIYKNGFKIEKRTKRQLILVIVLGFLSQYYFCMYALFLAIIMVIMMIRKKEYKALKSYIFTHLIAAVIGLALYPFCVEDIFFSYRGMAGLGQNGNYFTNIVGFAKQVFSAFSLPLVLGIILTTVFTGLCIYQFVKKDKKAYIALLTIPVVAYFLLAVKISPYVELRYHMPILPMISLCIILGIDAMFKNKKISIAVLATLVTVTSTYGFLTKEPQFLYKEYANYLQIAKENSDDNFVYVGTTMFNHVQSMLEFATYEKSLLLNKEQLNLLIDDEEIAKSDEFILCIKKFIGAEEVLNKVLENTKFTKSELLYDDNGLINCVLYKITK